jgi:acyl-CoA synthetase (AMP-forming)/AMP-acid ligase II
VTQPSELTTYNLADVWEAVSDRVSDRVALVCDDRRVTYVQLEAQANRLAHALADRGVGPGQHVGLYLQSGPEYFEAMLACYKLRAVPINVNHRYVEAELQHLFDDADVVGVIVHREFAARAEAVRPQLPGIGWWLVVDDATTGTEAAGAIEGEEAYGDALAAASSERDYGPRSNDDPYVIYTGGTTGLPKGVVWRHHDAFFACIGGADPMRLSGPVEEPAQVLERIIDGTFVFLPVAPLMHAAGQWTSLSWLFAGGTVVVLPGSLDAHRVWRTIQDEGVNAAAVVGDPVVRPLVDAWEAHGPFDVSSLFAIGSGGAPLSPALRDRLMALVPSISVTDGFGSSETGAQGAQRLAAGDEADGATRFTPYGDTSTVIDELTHTEIEPGSGQLGRVARRGHIPLGYYNDPDKTAATFVEVRGHRWVLTGDIATRAADGTIVLKGRGSMCINTGGEKVFVEEVEATLKSHPGVYDVLVVGAPDERWGERVVAVVAPTPGVHLDPAELIAHARTQLAGYKVPKDVVLVDAVRRSPAGKADYRWAQGLATDGAVAEGIEVSETGAS